MTTKVPRHLSAEEMTDLFYGEAPAAREAPAHLLECALCRREYEELREVLALCGAPPSPRLEEDYGEELWRRLRPEIERLDRQPSRWWLAAALAASVLAAAGLGVLGWRGAERPGARQAAAGRELLLLDAVGQHFERSQRLLVELVNAPGAPVGSPGVQGWARELLSANRLYRQLAAREEPELLPVLESLELALAETAHGFHPEVRDLLFDLRLAQLDVEQRWMRAAGISGPERRL